VYSPIEDLQRIEGSGAYKNADLNSMPKGIRYIGYFMIGFLTLFLLAAIIINLFF
jgi:hypothetical protein